MTCLLFYFIFFLKIRLAASALALMVAMYRPMYKENKEGRVSVCKERMMEP